MTVFIEGYNTPGDGGAGAFYWNTTSLGPDNGTTVIVPQPGVIGAWIRLISSYANGPPSSVSGDLVSFEDTTGKNLADSGISGTGGAFTQAATTQQFQDMGAKINRINDRNFLGAQATMNDANNDGLSTDWLTVFQTSPDELGFAQGTYSQFYVLNTNNPNSLNPIVCGTQTLYSIEDRDYTSISSFALNNSPSFVTIVLAFYGEGRQLNTTVGATYGAEFDVSTVAAFTTIDPYTPHAAQTVAIQVASGSGFTGFQYNTSAAINIQNNNSQFNMGIVFGSTAIVGATGSSGFGTAIAFALGHNIQWFGSSSTPTSSIRCFGTTSVNGTILNFGEGFTQFQNQSNGIQFQINNDTSSTNYLIVFSSGSSFAHTNQAGGSDTDINILLTPKGKTGQ